MGQNVNVSLNCLITKTKKHVGFYTVKSKFSTTVLVIQCFRKSFKCTKNCREQGNVLMYCSITFKSGLSVLVTDDGQNIHVSEQVIKCATTIC